jgi:hypothetical protein
MVYLYDACDQISDFCHQQLLRKMRLKISWTDGRTDGRTNRRTEVKQYTPLPGERGYNDLIITKKLGNRSFYFEKIQCKQLVIEHWSWESTLVFTIQNHLKKSSFM